MPPVHSVGQSGGKWCNTEESDSTFPLYAFCLGVSVFYLTEACRDPGPHQKPFPSLRNNLEAKPVQHGSSAMARRLRKECFPLCYYFVSVTECFWHIREYREIHVAG
jgi:hypothetical protein